MEDYGKIIETKLYDLMEPDDLPRDVLSLAEELRQEYPVEFKKFTAQIAEKYDLSVCGAHHAHINGILTILERWHEENKVEKIMEKGKLLWKKL